MKKKERKKERTDINLYYKPICRPYLLAQALGPPGADLWPGNPGKGSGNLGLIWARPRLVLDDDWIRSSHSRCGQQDGAHSNDGVRALKASLHRSLCFACGGCCESDLECQSASS